MISYCDENMTFNLKAGNTTSYIIKIVEGYVCHSYFGRAIPDNSVDYLLRLTENPYTPSVNNRDKAVFMDSAPFEYPCFGVGDYRESAFKILDVNGMSSCSLIYKSHRIFDGKPKLEGLPAAFCEKNEAQTLEILCEDKSAGIELFLIYTAFEKYPCIARSVRVVNKGDEPVRITRLLSASVDFDNSNYDMITLNGSWARERHLSRAPLRIGKQSIDSTRGETSHQSNCFFALCSHNADERYGEAYGFSLVYSGNFMAQAEVDQHGKCRAQIGINPEDFEWLLESGEELQSPEALLVYSFEGIGQMSRCYHDIMRNHLIRSPYCFKKRPILINNWEATYFNFDTDKLLDIAREASFRGIEMLVIDDGWFGHRDSDNSSLGDWFVYEKKLPGGLEKIANEVNALGMKLGIWFEPEMVSPDSELFRAHPDWAIGIPGRERTLCREQYVLDYSRSDVRDYIYGMLKKILDSANIEYVKWDMNRQLTEVGSAMLPAKRQRELWHRYVLGVYEMMERLVTDYPNILLENCSGGGARFDPGMLYYSPQIWCSDDTDAIERLKIQHGTTLCYPPSSMGAHVSICPNHTAGRTTPFSTRGHVALAGTFGYELDITALSDEDKNSIPAQIADYHRYAHLMLEGDYYRLGDVSKDSSFDAWMFVSKDKSEALMTFVQVNSRISTRSRRIHLDGLSPDKKYSCEGEQLPVLSGSTLMYAGINITELYGDFASKLIYLKEV